MTMGMNKPHRNFAERSYEPMTDGEVAMAWLKVYAGAVAILFAEWSFR